MINANKVLILACLYVSKQVDLQYLLLLICFLIKHLQKNILFENIH